MAPLPDMTLPPEIIDLTAKSPAKYRAAKPRMSAQVDAICLHQTALSRGVVPERYLEVHAHFVLLPDGRAVQLHPVSSWIVSSSAFNDDAIAIEVVGNFPDARGNYWQGDTYGRHTLSNDQIDGGRNLVKYLQETYGLSFIFAHRQGEDPKRRGNCPGPDVWYYLGEWAIRNLGMSDGGPGYTEGTGGAIPDSWRKPRI